jgi:DNA-binding HxlR family transcriptional regulator
MTAVINAPRGNPRHGERGIEDTRLPAFSEAASTCPVESVIEVVGGRWKLLVLRSLFLGGAQRFNSLLHSVDGISAKELTRNLRELENVGIVERGSPPASKDNAGDYRLSELGSSLLPVFREIGSFGERLRNSRMARHATRPAKTDGERRDV